jgi:hypothetical protein
MENSKVKRLENDGWQIGSTQDFLGLSDEESAFIELRLRVSDALRLRRQAARITQSAFAKMIESSQSRVAKMESGDPSVSLDLMIRSLMALGLTLEELGNIVSLRHDSNKHIRRSAKTRKKRQAA